MAGLPEIKKGIFPEDVKMKKTMKRNAIVAGALFLAVPGVAMAAPFEWVPNAPVDGSANQNAGGIVGDCADCHTMHNSELGKAVAIIGTADGAAGTAISTAPIQNLLRMDCIACHAQNGPDSIVSMGGGSAIPQVLTQDSDELAGGNFAYALADQRKGHNVVDLGQPVFDNVGTLGTAPAPPGKYAAGTHGTKFSFATAYDQFTCAGSVGCHGTRSQLLSGYTDASNVYHGTKRSGIAAISGAHHASYDGAKDATNYAGAAEHEGQRVADGYRFIPGLKGYGNTAARWQNVDENSHNEYYGAAGGSGTGCGACHNQGNSPANGGISERMTFDSNLKVPNNSMSGFCTTCHGMFHSGGGTDLQSNGVSGAFLRHPSDFVLPAEREYAGYTTYSITAPVARPTLYTAASSDVTPGTDMVMCLSCHKAHASENDFMLRFDYDAMEAGTASDGLGVGCLACHTEKGILPAGRN
jgi:hypothetical protein